MTPSASKQQPDNLLPALVAGLASEVNRLRLVILRELDRRPTAAIVRFNRVVGIVSLLVVMGVGIQLYNRTSAACGAGSRAQAAIVAVIKGHVHSLADLKRVYGYSVPEPACDIAFPLSTHSPGTAWPSGDNLIGMAALSAWLIGMGSVIGVYRIRADREDDRNERRMDREIPEHVTQEEEA